MGFWVSVDGSSRVSFFSSHGEGVRAGYTIAYVCEHIRRDMAILILIFFSGIVCLLLRFEALRFIRRYGFKSDFHGEDADSNMDRAMLDAGMDAVMI